MIIIIMSGFLYLFVLINVVVDVVTAAGNWQQSNAPISEWKGISMDGKGKYLLAHSSVIGENQTGIYLSSDSGKNWYNVPIDNSTAFNQWTASYTSQYDYMFALQENVGLFVAFTGFGIGTVWSKQIIDPDLAKLPPCEDAYYNALAVSDHSYVYVTAKTGAIYASANQGNKFSKTFNPSEYPEKNEWVSIATSLDGKYVAALSLQGLYFSTQYGGLHTWAKSDAPPNAWLRVQFSWENNASPSTVVAVARGSADQPGGIFLSTNVGKNWQVLDSLDTSLAWSAVHVNYNGQEITAAVDGGDIYYSKDQGKSFIVPSTTPKGEAWQAMVDDSYQLYYLVSSNNGHIYYSHSGI